MEEESLLKERLQAITDKRRIREDIRHKRRDIEEEKLKLQYIKKKSLREQWLMEGLQSEEEQETMKLQAQDELQRTTQLQSNILRMEKEMEELEAEELNISANEEAILRRLKEVERTTEDIIKELSVEPLSEISWPCPLPENDLADIFMEPPPQTPAPDQGPQELQEPKRATFAMEISVELDKRTGKAQVISTATVTPDIIHGKGLKVYEDGRKSVYALPPSGGGGDVSEMTPTDVEELLRQATDWSGDVQYHQPVHAAPFTKTSRPSTPLTSSKTTSPNLVHSKTIGSPNLSQSRAGSRLEAHVELEESIDTTLSDDMQTTDDRSDGPYAILGSITTNLDAITTPAQPVYNSLETSPSKSTGRCELDVITKSPNHDQLLPSYINTTTDKYANSKTLSPAFSCSETGIESFRKDMDLDVIQIKNLRKNVDETLYSVNDFCNLLSENPSSPTQPTFKDIEKSSLLVTHRYELDLIERSMNKYKASPTDIAKHQFSQSKTPSPALSHGEPRIKFESKTITAKPASNMERHADLPSASGHHKAALVSLRESSDGMPTLTWPVYKNIETSASSLRGHGVDGAHLDRNSPTYTDSTVNSIVEELEPGAVTMIFMGYENADEDEEDSIQAEVVVIGDSEDEEESLATIYHPNGYTSRVYRPAEGVAKVTGGQGWGEEHKPTFRHRAGRSQLCL